MLIMIIMNRTDRYRLEALIELARIYPEARPSAELAVRRRIPAAYLSRLLADLARSGLVHSRRGPGGGVALARPPGRIPVATVVVPPAGDSALPPALARLADLVQDAAERAVAGLYLADLVRWEGRAAADYSI
jgi:DNA-binding IscR family transcriptional regulator